MIDIFYTIKYGSFLLLSEDKPVELSEEEVMRRLAKEEGFREKLLKYNPRGSYGSLSITFYKHKFIVEHEAIWSMLFKIHISSIECILNNALYRNHFEGEENDYMIFDFVDAKDTGVRLRHYGEKVYENFDEEILYVSSSDYLKQEIILDKWEYMDKMLACAERFIAYRDILKCEGDFHLELWRTRVEEFKKRLVHERPDKQ